MKKLSGLMFTIAAASLAHQASATDLNVCQTGCVFPTIQSAIDNSRDNDVIHIAAGTYFENLQVPNRQLTIVGAGQDLTVIDGRQRGSVVTIGTQTQESKANTIAIIGVTITHGNAPHGGGILVNFPVLDLQNSIVSSNTATQSGGGIDLQSRSITAKITGTLIVHNRAGTVGAGIALEQDQSAQISNSSIVRNTATLGGGGLYFGINVHSMISSSTIADNTSQQNGGGALFDPGDPRPQTAISGSSIVGNHAAVNGGGIFDAGSPPGLVVVFGNNTPNDIFPVPAP
jgi:hypothetical protein